MYTGIYGNVMIVVSSCMTHVRAVVLLKFCSCSLRRLSKITIASKLPLCMPIFANLVSRDGVHAPVHTGMCNVNDSNNTGILDFSILVLVLDLACDPISV